MDGITDKPLIIGISEYLTKSIKSEWFSVLRTIMSKYLVRTLAVSDIVSKFEICNSLLDTEIDFPPIWNMPTSKENLVLVEGFLNNATTLLSNN